jgi:phosphohistidine phosphatase
MLRLSIVRHAKSSWADAGRPDFERPLNERGRTDAPRMAARLRAEGLVPDRLLSSPALRAITTARIFAGVFGHEAETVALDSRIYEASVDNLYEVLRTQGSGAAHLMLFSHNPGLSELAMSLAPCPFSDMPTCAVASFDLDIRRWSALAPQLGRLTHYRFPKDGS